MIYLKMLCVALVGITVPAVAQETDGRNPVSTAPLELKGADDYLVLSRGGDAGDYAAFPDATRLANGDIAAVFYTGGGHVSLPGGAWPKGGKICMVRSADEGRTWTKPATIFDDGRDNRDPHIARLSDGTLAVTFFSLMPKVPGTTKAPYVTSGTEIITSKDGGATWSDARAIAEGWYVSAPVRELKDGTCLLGVYGNRDGEKLGGVLISKDKGVTWSEPRAIGTGQKLPLDAETDVIELNDGRIFAALRTTEKNLYYAYSSDKGETWSPVVDSGFRGHAPHLTRLSTGEILMPHRLPDTSLHVSRDDTKTWDGPYRIDRVYGAYASTLELKDGSVLIVYYTEGKGSEVRARRFKLEKDGLEFLAISK